jgi:hypothetical protein
MKGIENLLVNYQGKYPAILDFFNPPNINSLLVPQWANSLNLAIPAIDPNLLSSYRTFEGELVDLRKRVQDHPPLGTSP